MYSEIARSLSVRYKKRCEDEKQKAILPILNQEVWIYPENAMYSCAILDAKNDVEIIVTAIAFLCRNDNGNRIYSRDEAYAMLEFLTEDEILEIGAVVLEKRAEVKKKPPARKLEVKKSANPRKRTPSKKT